MSDIQGGLRVTAPIVTGGQGGAAARLKGEPAPAQAQKTVAEFSRPVIVPIERPDIKVDTEGDKKRLDKAIEQMNERMNDGGRGLAFRVDPAVSRPVVTVTNRETGEVIRQIPNEVVVKMAHSIDDNKGNLLNAKV
jgi:flagellar protein FlaG